MGRFLHVLFVLLGLMGIEWAFVGDAKTGALFAVACFGVEIGRGAAGMRSAVDRKLAARFSFLGGG
jgi:hypothetical protein